MTAMADAGVVRESLTSKWRPRRILESDTPTASAGTGNLTRHGDSYPKIIQKVPSVPAPTLPDVSQIPGTWWVTKVNADDEEWFVADLVRAQIASYVPRSLKKVKHGNRETWKAKSLIPGYVPFAGTIEDLWRVLDFPQRCKSVRPVADQRGFVRDLRGLQLQIQNDQYFGWFDGVRPGQKCYIKRHHSFEGFTAHCDHFLGGAGKLRVVVTIAYFGRMVPLELDAQDIEPVS